MPDLTPQKPTRNQTPKLVEFTRHLPGPPRRSPGQRCFLSTAEIRSQQLKRGDFRVVKPNQPPQ